MPAPGAQATPERASTGAQVEPTVRAVELGLRWTVRGEHAGLFQIVEAALDEALRAHRALIHGDPSVYLRLFAQRDEISLGNPFSGGVGDAMKSQPENSASSHGG
jgi:hypothetical protein